MTLIVEILNPNPKIEILGEVQEDISCREFEGVPQFPFFLFPQEWGPGG